MLNLCHTANAEEDSEFRSQTGLDPPMFVVDTILGDIGNPLRTLPDDLYNESDSHGRNGSDADITSEVLVRDHNTGVQYLEVSSKYVLGYRTYVKA